MPPAFTRNSQLSLLPQQLLQQFHSRDNHHVTVGGDAQPPGRRSSLRYAGPCFQQIPTAGVSEDVKVALAKVLGQSVDLPLCLYIPLAGEWEQHAQHQQRPADGSAGLLVAAAIAAAKTTAKDFFFILILLNGLGLWVCMYVRLISL